MDIFIVLWPYLLTSKDVNGLGDGKLECPCGPLKWPEDSYSENFVPVVLTLYHAFQLGCNKTNTLGANSL